MSLFGSGLTLLGFVLLFLFTYINLLEFAYGIKYISGLPSVSCETIKCNALETSGNIFFLSCGSEVTVFDVVKHYYNSISFN